MPFNGAGTFTRTNGVNTGSGTWAADAAAGTPILASRQDTHDQDIADALSSCIVKDGQTTPTANLPMGGYKHTGVANASSRSDYAAAGQVQDGGLVYAGASTGSSNAYVVTMTPSISAYTAGQSFTFIPNFTNTGATTANVNSKGAKTVQYLGKACVGGEIVSGVPATIVYDGTNFQLLQHGGGWATYTPTYSATAPLTLGTTSSQLNVYQRHGDRVYIQVRGTGTTGGSAGQYLNVTLPINAADAYQSFTATVYNNTTSKSIAATCASTGLSAVTMSQNDGSNFTTGVVYNIYFSGVYKV